LHVDELAAGLVAGVGLIEQEVTEDLSRQVVVGVVEDVGEEGVEGRHAGSSGYRVISFLGKTPPAARTFAAAGG
jgi:hypothetical protein